MEDRGLLFMDDPVLDRPQFAWCTRSPLFISYGLSVRLVHGCVMTLTDSLMASSLCFT